MAAAGTAARAANPQSSPSSTMHRTKDGDADGCRLLIANAGRSTTSSSSTRTTDNDRAALQQLAPWFALLSLAYMGPWTALGALMPFFTRVHGPRFVVQLNCSFYLPGLPMALLQQWGDEALDARLGSVAAYLGRNVGALAVAVGVLLALPAVYSSADAAYAPSALVLALTAVLGAAAWLAHGTATTLVVMFPPRALACLQTGFRLPEAWALAMVTLLNVDAHPDPGHLRLFLYLTAAVAVAGLVTWVGLVSHPATRALLRLKDKGGAEAGPKACVVGDATPPAHLQQQQQQQQQQPPQQPPPTTGKPRGEEDASPLLPLASLSSSNMHHQQLVRLTEAEKAFVEETISPCTQALFVTIASSIFLSSFLAYVRSPGPHAPGYCVCEVLYFVRLFADLAGRPLAALLPRPRWLQASSSGLLHLALARLLLAALFFGYIGLPGVFPQSDALVVGLVAVFSLLSGVCVVLAFADAAAAVAYSPAYQCHAGASMNLTFQAAAFAGVLLGMVFVDMGAVEPPPLG